MFAYLLHFIEPIEHAQHYLGATTNLPRRLYTHAIGEGAVLTREFQQRVIPFVLARLWQVHTYEDSRTFPLFRLEKILKGRKNGRKLCPLCTPEQENGALVLPERFPAHEYDLDIIPFPLFSKDFVRWYRTHRTQP